MQGNVSLTTKECAPGFKLFVLDWSLHFLHRLLWVELSVGCKYDGLLYLMCGLNSEVFFEPINY